VVQAHALAQPRPAGGELGRNRGQAHLEELEHGGRDVGPRRGPPLHRGIPGQPEHLGADAIERPRMALLSRR